MSRKRFKFRRMPACRKFDDASMQQQHEKVISEFREWAQAYADCCRNADKGITSREDFAHLMSETFDLTQVAQQFIHIAVKNHGGHYAMTEDDLYCSGFKKNNDRGYYDEKPKESPYADYINNLLNRYD